MNKNNEGPNLKPEAEKRREEVILNWIRDSLTSDPQFFMKDRYLDVEGGDMEFFRRMQGIVESRPEGLSFFYSASPDSNKWKIGVVKKHQAK